MLRVALFGILLALVNCDLKCFYKSNGECSAEMWKNKTHEQIRGACNVKYFMLECMTKASTKCNIPLTQEIAKVKSVYEKVCEEGSRLNNDFEKYKHCFYESALYTTPCFIEIKDYLKDKQNLTLDLVLDIQKFSCRKLDGVMNCISEITAARCGRDAYAFYRFLMDPEIALSKKLCKQFKEEEDADMPLSFFMSTIMMK